MQVMNKILMGQQYVANFLDQPLRIGSVFRMDDKQSILALHFNDAFPDVDLTKYTDSGSKGTLKFSEQKTVEVKFGGSATTNLGASEVSLRFRKSRSVVGAFADVYVEALRYGAILDKLKELWTSRGFVPYRTEYFLVFEVVTAASGTLVYSEDKNNEVVLKHKLGEKVTSVVDLGSGNFEYVSNTKRTLEIIKTTAHRPLFKAFWLRKNWEPEVLG